MVPNTLRGDPTHMDLHRHPFRPVPVRRQSTGFCAEGPGFYVWDEDPRTVRDTASELGGRRTPSGATPSANPPGDDRDDALR
jgi:hypothetical protein